MDAKFSHGKPLMVDHSSASDVAEGDVVVVGQVPFVCHRPIPANGEGHLAAGGGVYEGVSDGTLDTGGALVYWDDTANKFSGSATSNKHFGFTEPSQGATNDGDTIRVIHSPTGV